MHVRDIGFGLRWSLKSRTTMIHVGQIVLYTHPLTPSLSPAPQSLKLMLHKRRQHSEKSWPWTKERSSLMQLEKAWVGKPDPRSQNWKWVNKETSWKNNNSRQYYGIVVWYVVKHLVCDIVSNHFQKSLDIYTLKTSYLKQID